ncbi:MAG TPA: penicillin-binding transpeptidase domain-containing protein [Candidatus Paceibacterota bacterium]|nr:penicillin-binding transpeptidase domain-containing protein [Candidatus Paceibacterota bacterium]
MRHPFFYKQKRSPEIAPDEIFMDSHNSPRFDIDQFEGRIERPIRRGAIIVFFGVVGLLGLLLLGKTFVLQIVSGADYREQAENNRLAESLIFADRGVIVDRTGAPLAWNESFATTTTEEPTFARRLYADAAGLAHILGFVSYPKKDRAGFYFQDAIEGRDGIERQYDELLAGTPGRRITEEDALGTAVSQSVMATPEPGRQLTLSIDMRVQDRLATAMNELAHDVGFAGGASIIMDVRTGEILALVSTPSYEPQVMSDGIDSALIESYTIDPATPFLNRAIGGRYTPGSIMKPFLAIGALSEGLISPDKQIYSDGALTVPNPFNPDMPTIFKDWKAHGWTDMRRAIAVSSNVYFMTIGGGFADQKGLGIEGIEEYARLFKIGEPTGIDLSGEVGGTIPNIAWKRSLFPDDPWRVGDTYNTSIGQYGFQVTVAQMARATAAIANNGVLVTPRLLMDGGTKPTETIDVDPETLRIVREGMRLGVMEGTARALGYPDLAVAAKTGTAELGVSKEKVNSWVMGFWPYEDPRFAFATVMEKGPVTNLIGSASVMRRVVDWMRVETPEYLK